MNGKLNNIRDCSVAVSFTNKLNNRKICLGTYLMNMHMHPICICNPYGGESLN